MRSFRYAVDGLWFVLRTQHNAWLHLIATMVVVAVGAFVRLERADWQWIAAAIALVWIAEVTNTAVEHLCDAVSPDFHPSVRKAKDVAAGAVLIAAVAAAIIGGLVFWPYLVR